jgi:succinate-acetate transporter protein
MACGRPGTSRDDPVVATTPARGDTAAGGPAPERSPVTPPASLAAARVVLRPIANPFPLGFLGLAGATLVLSGQELGAVPVRESLEVALIVLLTAPVLQLVACVFGFLGRDPVAATGMGTLAVTWAAIGAVHALARPGSYSAALGLFLFLASAAMLLSASVAVETKGIPALVMGLTAIRFLVTGLDQVLASPTAEEVAGAIGCLLAAVALYGAFATELEGLEHRTVLPTLRRGRGERALDNDLAEHLATVAAEPGVRSQL